MQLNRLDWRAYLRQPNPMAAALMAKMRIEPQDRPKVKVECLRLLATLTAQRDPAFPDVPTARGQGIDVTLEAWRGIAVPKGTPTPVIAALEGAIKKTVESTEFVQGCERLGARPAFAPADQFGKLIAKEDGQLASLMKIIGLKK